jgi:hypothetical protein
METAIQKTTQELMQEVVDSKVTRTELLDLIVDRVAKEIQAEIADLEKEKEAIVAKTKIKPKDVRKFFNADDVTLDISTGWGVRADTVRLKLEIVDFPVSQLPEKYEQRKVLLKPVSERLNNAYARLRQLRDGKSKARLAMVQESLTSTPQGRRILEAIDGLKETVKARLLGSGVTP